MKKYLGIDIGGTWIKGTCVVESVLSENGLSQDVELSVNKVPSNLRQDMTPDDFKKIITKLIESFNISATEVSGIAISTAGIINYHGTKILKASEYLDVLKTEEWREYIEQHLDSSVKIINDADATVIGLSELGYLQGNKAVGIMPIGTGVGFSVWKNGRNWQPGKILPLVGSISTPEGDYNSLISASRLASKDCNNDLLEVLTNPEHEKYLSEYLDNLEKVINTAGIIYNLDEVIICGGLSDAVHAAKYPLEKILNERLSENQRVELDKPLKVVVPTVGNKLQLIGALGLAYGEFVAEQGRVNRSYTELSTEKVYSPELQLQTMSTLDIITTFNQAEVDSGKELENSFPVLTDFIDKATINLQKGGRLIYVGAGTSGRIASMDAVEIPCTYGFPEDRIIALIAGGISDASIEIESNYEEDASSVPEMLLLNIQSEDVVIGISASGSAYYVQSALSFSKNRGALTSMIQASEDSGNNSRFTEYTLPLYSGYEVVAGSTRMKAGTATKKILNIISSTIMIKMGKVYGSFMIDHACLNNKLEKRANSILRSLFGLDEKESSNLLKESGMSLKCAIEKYNNKKDEK